MAYSNLINHNGSNHMLNWTHRKDQKQKKNGGKGRKELYKSMKNAIYGKNGKHEKKNWCKTCKQPKILFKMDMKTKPNVTRISDNDLVAIHKNLKKC